MPGVDPAIRWLAAASLAAVFAGSAIAKLRDLTGFRDAVENYRIVPRRIAACAAGIIPLAEIAGAIGILFGPTREASALLLLGLLVVFTAAIGVNLARGRRDIDCGCFGTARGQRLSGGLLVRNAMLIALAAVLLLPAGERRIGALDVMTIFFGAAALVTLYAAFNYLLAQASALRAVEMRHG
jgi:uncharacterized membrane protein